MRHCAILLFLSAIICAAEPAHAVQTLEWCTVTAPATAPAGKPLEVSVTLTRIPEGVKSVNVDLHGGDAGGAWKGVLAGGGPHPAVLDKPGTWRIAFTAPEGVATVVPVIFLSTEGSWKTKTASLNAAPIPVK